MLNSFLARAALVDTITVDLERPILSRGNFTAGVVVLEGVGTRIVNEEQSG